MDGVGVVLGHVEYHIEAHRQQLGADGTGAASRVAPSSLFGIGAHVADCCHTHGLGHDMSTRRRYQSPAMSYSVEDALRQLKGSEGISLRAIIESSQLAHVARPQLVHAKGRHGTKIGR